MNAVPRQSGDPAVLGVLCTYGRSQTALDYLRVLDAQSRRPDAVYVIDNSSDPWLEEQIKARLSTLTHVRYIDPEANIGPAGAFSMGFQAVARHAQSDDVVIFLDDDDPPVLDTQIERLVGQLVRERERDPRTGGIGLSGGTLGSRTGMIAPTPDTGGVVDVDHLHGGYLPCYSVEALAAVKGNDESFFYGFEELELGRRLRGGGYRLLVDLDGAAEASEHYPKKSSDGSTAQQASTEGEWSRFHKERNLIRILRRERNWTAIMFPAPPRHVAKPLLTMVRRPSAGWKRLVLGVRAAYAGICDEGGIDPRYAPPVRPHRESPASSQP